MNAISHSAWRCFVSLLLLTPAFAAPTIPNPSFEIDAAFTNAPGAVSGNAAITGWATNDPASVGLNPGVSFNGYADNGAVPDGARVAFVASDANTTTTLSTTISGLTVGKWYRVQFRVNRYVTGGSTAPQPSYRLDGGPAIPFYMGLGAGGSNPYYTMRGLFCATATTAALEISNTTATLSALLVDHFTVTEATPLIVTTNADSGAGSLRAALDAAKDTDAFNLITFAPALNAGTITLGSQITINDASGVVIDASSLAGGVTIRPSGTDIRLFFNTTASRCAMRGLILADTNTSLHAGAILNEGTMQLSRCGFRNNRANGVGGAVFNGSHLIVTDCQFTDNYSAIAAAALMHQGASLSVSRCSFIGNHANALGGAFYATTGPMEINNSTFQDNSTSGAGGAVYFDQLVSHARFTHCTFSGNTGAYGGAITNGGDMSVKNCIIFNNTASVNGSTSDVENNGFNGAAFTREGANIIGAYANTSGGTDSGPAALTDDPFLSAPASIGGYTLVMALHPTSPALNAAVDSTSTHDQRGYPVSGTADLGAFELQPVSYFHLTTGSAVVQEGQSFPVLITRSDTITGSTTVRLITTPGTAGAADFTARADVVGSDVSFAGGDAEKEVLITTTRDALVESNETFNVSLSSPASPSILGTYTSMGVTVIEPHLVTTANDDGPGSLRQALRDAALVPGENGITFASTLSGQTITLGSEIGVNDADGVTVDATHLSVGLTIDGGPGENRLFDIGPATSSALTLRGLTLTGGNGNAPGTPGGAIFTRTGSTLTLERCTLTGNATSNAPSGAIQNEGTCVLTQCTLSGNNAVGVGVAGGAILNVGTLTLTHCTLAGNYTDGSGGAICNFGILTLEHSILANNTAISNPSSNDVFNGNAGTVDFAESSIVVEFLDAGTLVNGGNHSVAAPLLGPLASNGGPTKTFALLSGSPAIDAATGSTITSDQRGRPVVGVADIGAYESQAGGTFAFSATGYLGTEGSIVAITIQRLGGREGTASVRLFTAFGSAKASDFTPRPNDATSDVVFADDEASRTVNIPLTGDILGEVNETFTVNLGSPSLGAAIGSLSTASVSIESSSVPLGQNKLPSVSISSPAANGRVNVDDDGTLVITGNATDYHGVNAVYVTVNGSMPLFAGLEKPGAVSTKFTIVLMPSEFNTGLNTVEVTTNGYSFQNSLPLTRTFRVLRPLLVNVSGFGNTTPTGFVQKSYREVGRPHTLTAAPSRGQMFVGWSIISCHTPTQLGINTSALELAKLTFIHREGLALRATFVPSPFTSAVVGTYDGGIIPNDELPTISALDTQGYASIKLLPTSAFTGYLLLDGDKLILTGHFDSAGRARFGPTRSTLLTLVRKNKAALSLALEVNFTSGLMQGYLLYQDGSGRRADIFTARSPFSATSPVPDIGYLVPDTPYVVQFFPDEPGQQPSGYQTADFPHGYGHGTAKVSKTGLVTLSGQLPDGEAISASTTLSQAHTFHIFAQLYKKKGIVAANAEFTGKYTDIDFSAFDQVWMRPVQDTQHYPGGWPAGLSLDIGGTKHAPVNGSSLMTTMPALVQGDLNGNANLHFSDGISVGFTKTIGITSTDTVSYLPADPSYTLKIDRKTGYFSGTVTLPSGAKVPYKGTIKGKNVGIGYGYYLTPTPKPKDYLGRSGRVTLEIQQ